jgi:predicted esterase
LPSDQEIKNRSVLAVLAEELEMRIAVPRASSRCSENTVCWGWALDDEDVKRALKEVANAAASCNLPDRKLGLIGFSNGGYLVVKLFRADMFKEAHPKIHWGIAVGSAMIKGPIEPHPFRVGGQLTLIIGNKDTFNYDPEQNYLKQLRRKSPSVQLREFAGGHELPLNETRDVIFELTN